MHVFLKGRIRKTGMFQTDSCDSWTLFLLDVGNQSVHVRKVSWARRLVSSSGTLGWSWRWTSGSASRFLGFGWSRLGNLSGSWSIGHKLTAEGIHGSAELLNIEHLLGDGCNSAEEQVECIRICRECGCNWCGCRDWRSSANGNWRGLRPTICISNAHLFAWKWRK